MAGCEAVNNIEPGNGCQGQCNSKIASLNDRTVENSDVVLCTTLVFINKKALKSQFSFVEAGRGDNWGRGSNTKEVVLFECSLRGHTKLRRTDRSAGEMTYSTTVWQHLFVALAMR